jgi:Prophage minor tail protein Z (GPZ)
MPISVRVEVDAAPVLAVLEALSSPAFEQVAALALTDTVKNAQVQVAAQMAPAMGLPSRDVKADLRIEPARSDHLEAALVAAGRPIPMIRFRPKASRTGGVTVRIGGDTETYRRAFITNVRNAHRGVFERVGKARLPIRELYGPSVPGFFKRTDVLPVVQTTMRDRLLVNLMRQLDRRMRREQGKHRRG